VIGLRYLPLVVVVAERIEQYDEHLTCVLNTELLPDGYAVGTVFFLAATLIGIEENWGRQRFMIKVLLFLIDTETAFIFLIIVVMLPMCSRCLYYSVTRCLCIV
jgi:hypothetical protein